MNGKKTTQTAFLLLSLGGSLLAIPACGDDGGAPATNTAGGGSAGAASGGKAGSSGGGSAGASGAAAGKAGASGAGAGAGGSAGAAGGTKGGASGAGPSGPGGACKVDADCNLAGVEATPAGCVEPFCKTGTCALRSIDADGDGFRTKKCKLVSDGAFAVEVGADCDDANKDTNPKAWDGPAGDGNPDRCADGVDQDCSGVDGDAVLANGASCSCTPGDTEKCAQTSGGAPIDYPGGKPAAGSECKLGDRTCVADVLSGGGKWGPCTGAVGPSPEVCNGGAKKDEDCDGEADEADADGKLEWVYDRDGDGSRASTANADSAKPRVPFASIQACAKPTATPPECTAAYCGATPIAECCPSDKWRLANTATSFDCDDNDNAVFPGAPEVCAVTSGPSAKDKDDNCNGTVDELPAVGASLWFYDKDDDGYGDENTAAKTSCASPGPGWKTAIPNTDCNDETSAIRPGIAEDCKTAVDDNCNKSTTDTCDCTVADPPQDCGKPGDCAYLPGGSACVNGKYQECPAPIQKQEYCPDADADSACVLGECAQFCPTVVGSGGPSVPMGYAKRDTCGTLTDCNDQSNTQAPGLKELCGDAVDTDCDGDPNNGYFLGSPCDINGSKLGACLNGGVTVCNGPNQSTCQAQGGVPSQTSHVEAAPNTSFDWNCDGLSTPKVSKSVPQGGPGTPCLKTVEVFSEASYCVAVHKKSAAPYSWKTSTVKCIQPAIGPGESIPTCAQLSMAACFDHYYFVDCRNEVFAGLGNVDVTCSNPCGREIAVLECTPNSAGTACVDGGTFLASCGEPYISCR